MSVTYKFYKAQVTGGGYLPQGHCLATLSLDENRNPTWSDLSEEFERLCLPLFESSVRMGLMDKFESLKPYSEEALQHLSKRQLPSQGFVMVTVKDIAPRPPSQMGFAPGTYFPPPGLLKPSPPKPGSDQAPD